MDNEWMSYIKTDYKAIIEKVLKDKEVLCPPIDKIFRCLELTPPKSVKVVILAQDPYPSEQAMGLAFSVMPNTGPLPSSLKNIIQNIKQNDVGFSDCSGDLTKWAERGVLLLNTILTTKKGIIGAHKGVGWELLTDEVISYVNEYCNFVIFMLWGGVAQEKEKLIDQSKHKVLKTSHPSGQSVMRGFNSSRHFATANKLLVANGCQPIDWRL